MIKNLHQFKNTIKEFGNVFTKKEAELITKNIGFRILADLQAPPPTGTPVDTGRARNNWFFDKVVTDYIDEREVYPTTPTVQNPQASEVMYIFNNLPYIARLETGYSSQNSFFTKKALMRAENLAAELIKEKIKRVR